FYSLARNRLAPRQLGHTHKQFRTPNVAIIWMSVFALVVSLLFGWKWGPLNGFFTIATLAVPPVIIVYMLVSAGSVVWYWRKARSKFNVLLHLVLPVGGVVLFFFPLYYQFVKYPPVYPEKYGNWLNSATGPVAVKGAEPGDSLEAEIHDVRPIEWGVATLIPGFGQLIDQVQKPLTRMFEVKDGLTRQNERIAFPARPMVGVVGVAT